MKATDFTDPRRSPHVRETMPIRFAIASERYRLEHEGKTIDCSSHGLGIRTPVPLSCGEVAVVMMQGSVRTAVPTRVVWVHGTEFGIEGAAGLEFLQSLPP